jgi:hypothetical protein
LPEVVKIPSQDAAMGTDASIARKGGDMSKVRIKVRMGAAVLLASLMLIATSVVVPGSLGAINVGPGKGNPQTTPSGHCPGGQNKDTSTGGLKKCP